MPLAPPSAPSGQPPPPPAPEPAPAHLVARLQSPGPKRILALDGGGIRGVITLRFLARIEATLREESGDPELVLADYFDLMGGTSTGAILATALSLGWSVERVAGMYRELAAGIFRPRHALLGPVAALFGGRYDVRPLEAALARELGELRLDTPELRTGLVVIAKRADTASVWQLTNIPGHRFYEMNRHLLLRELVRASSAAPTFFDPQRIGDVGDGHAGIFVDGGVSMHTNPALQMLLVAGLGGFGLRWPLGEDRLLLCSVGTGAHLEPPPAASIRGYRQVQWLSQLMVHLLRDASELGETLLQWVSQSPTARPIDRQVGDLAGDLATPEPLLRYLRYDIPLEPTALEGLGFVLTPAELAGLRSLAGYRHVPLMEAVGEAAARHRVQAGHFPPELAPWEEEAQGAVAPSGGTKAAPEGASHTAPARRSTRRAMAVTGHRPPALDGVEAEALDRRLDAVLTAAEEVGIRTLVSALAEGADRRVAHLALDARWHLQALLPFPPDRYERDFADAPSRAEFRGLLAQASSTRVVPEDGDPGAPAPEETASGPPGSEAPPPAHPSHPHPALPYRTLGRALLDDADLLLALWDGGPPRGPGGTAEVVARARERDLPVIWVHAHPPHAVHYFAPGASEPQPVPAPWRITLLDLLRGAEAPSPGAAPGSAAVGR